MQITEGTIEEILDPTGIIEGRRFEIHLTALVDEDDELFHSNGTGLRLLYAVKGEEKKLLNYQFYELATGAVFDVEWTMEEQQQAEQYSLSLLAGE